MNYDTYEQASKRLCMAVSGKAADRERLASMPHIDKADLSIWFYIYPDAGDRTMKPFQTVPILCVTNALAGKWGVTERDLFRDALRSTPDILAPSFDTLSSSISRNMELVSEQEQAAGSFLQQNPENIFSFPMPGENPCTIYVLTNRTQMLGASAIFYPGLLREISTRLREDIIIIPSSIHEVLLLSMSYASVIGMEELGDIVREVNQNVVSPKEVLSNSIYYYECACDDFTVMNVRRWYVLP